MTKHKTIAEINWKNRHGHTRTYSVTVFQEREARGVGVEVVSTSCGLYLCIRLGKRQVEVGTTVLPF